MVTQIFWLRGQAHRGLFTSSSPRAGGRSGWWAQQGVGGRRAEMRRCVYVHGHARNLHLLLRKTGRGSCRGLLTQSTISFRGKTPGRRLEFTTGVPFVSLVLADVRAFRPCCSGTADESQWKAGKTGRRGFCGNSFSTSLPLRRRIFDASGSVERFSLLIWVSFQPLVSARSQFSESFSL